MGLFTEALLGPPSHRMLQVIRLQSLIIACQMREGKKHCNAKVTQEVFEHKEPTAEEEMVPT